MDGCGLHGSRDLAMSLIDMGQQYSFVGETLRLVGQPHALLDPAAPRRWKLLQDTANTGATAASTGFLARCHRNAAPASHRATAGKNITEFCR